MITLHDINMIEGEAETADDYYTALQHAINDGAAWSLQGSYGRAMMAAIESGACMLGTRPARDCYGNRIPSRSEVKAGTKGSAEFVREQMGDDWAAAMEAVA